MGLDNLLQPAGGIAFSCYRATADGRSWPAGLPGMWGRAAGLGNIPCAGHRRTRWTWCGLQQGGGDLRLFFHCWRGHGQAPQSQALSQRLAWGLLSGGGFNDPGLGPGRCRGAQRLTTLVKTDSWLALACSVNTFTKKANEFVNSSTKNQIKRGLKCLLS